MAQQLPLDLPEIDPRTMQQACRKLARMVAANRRSFKCIDYAKRRNAMLKSSRALSEG